MSRRNPAGRVALSAPPKQGDGERGAVVNAGALGVRLLGALLKPFALSLTCAPLPGLRVLPESYWGSSVDLDERPL